MKTLHCASWHDRLLRSKEISVLLVLLSGGVSAQPTYELQVPTPIEISSVTKTTVSVLWNDEVGDDVGYILERRSLGGGWRRVTIIPDDRSPSDQPEPDAEFRFVDSDLAADTYYCYRLLAFNDEAFSISEERCTRTDSAPTVAAKQELPGFLSVNSPSGFADLVPGETISCTDPKLEAAIEAALEGLAKLGVDPPNDKYICETDGYGVDDAFKDFIDAFPSAECAGTGLAVGFMCGAASVAWLGCAKTLPDGEQEKQVPITSCVEDVAGFKKCKTEQGSAWIPLCLGGIGLTAGCLKVAEGFGEQCL